MPAAPDARRESCGTRRLVVTPRTRSQQAPLPPGYVRVSPELEAVVMQLLAKAPDDRVPAPARVAELLRPFVAGCDLQALARPCPGGDPAAIEPPHASTIDRHRTTFALGAEAALRQRQGESRATSATVPRRCSGTERITDRRDSSSGVRRAMPSVPSIGPGTMELTRMPRGPHSSARTLVTMSTPALAAHA